MARDHMIYDDKMLVATTADNVVWPTVWSPKALARLDLLSFLLRLAAELAP